MEKLSIACRWLASVALNVNCLAVMPVHSEIHAPAVDRDERHTWVLEHAGEHAGMAGGAGLHEAQHSPVTYLVGVKHKV